MDEPEFPWPEPGHTFFKHEKTRDDAFSWFHGRELREYAYTYWESTQVLLERACDAPGLLNSYAIPAVFMFRHYVELSLKDLILTARSLNDEPPEFKDGHRLLPLWRELETLSRAAGALTDSTDAQLFTTVGEMITELDSVDPQSMSFHYPVGKADKTTGVRPVLLADEFEYFDMRVFRDQARRLASFLRGASDQLEDWLETKQDIERYYGP